MYNKKIFLIALTGIFVLFFNISSVFAYRIEENPIVKNSGDFAVGAGKIEAALDPGATTTREIDITNRMGKDAKFKVSVEDFGPSDKPGEVTQLYANNDGPYSLRKYLKPELTEFTLKQGEVMYLPVEIKIPADAPAGGLYGSVLISNVPDLREKNPNGVSGDLGIESRIGVLFFVRVNGDIIQDGDLLNFSPGNYFYTTPRVKLSYVYKNDGDIYVNPYGIIIVRDMFGREVLRQEIKPYFVLPKSARTI